MLDNQTRGTLPPMQSGLETLTEPVRSEDQPLARRRSDLADQPGNFGQPA